MQSTGERVKRGSTVYSSYLLCSSLCNLPSVCGKVEGDTQSLLPRFQIGLVELVALLDCAIARVLVGGREGGREGEEGVRREGEEGGRDRGRKGEGREESIHSCHEHTIELLSSYQVFLMHIQHASSCVSAA